MLKNFKLVLLIIFLSGTPLLPQEADIVPYLRQIENGNKDGAMEALLKLEQKSPNDPSVQFLRGVLTENGQKSAEIYTSIVKKHHRSKYADAALYRLFAFYYAVGLYEDAYGYSGRLTRDYPNSPYIKLVPDEMPESGNEVPLETPPQSTTPGEPYVYTIQAGAFSSASNAQALKEDFERSGFKSEIKEKNVGGSVFKIVYVGKFYTEEEALSFLQVINSEFQLEGRVVFINHN